jgi:hypothetical protein
VTLNGYGKHPRELDTRLGLGFQAQAVAMPLPALGIGLTFFGNANPRQSFGGFVIALSFGRLR